MVMLGAEALAENGGLVNFVGGYQMAQAAKAADKPVYALAERCVSPPSIIEGIKKLRSFRSFV